MKNIIKILAAVLALILFSVFTAAESGVCELEKGVPDTYNPGETAAFTCSCTLPNEENVVGNFVWRNSTGAILRNVTANSAACRTSVFFDFYTFPKVAANYSGNATFETALPELKDWEKRHIELLNPL